MQTIMSELFAVAELPAFGGAGGAPSFVFGAVGGASVPFGFSSGELGGVGGRSARRPDVQS